MSSLSPYGSPDTFGSSPTTAPRITDPLTGLTWTLGFGAHDAFGVPAVVWTVTSTWAIAKARLGPTWASAKAHLSTWGAAKAVVGA